MTERASGQDFENDRELFPEELAERYEPLECVKSKEGCETFYGVARADGRKVVIKRYAITHPNFGAESSYRTLAHPSIPAFVEEWRDDKRYFIIREYVEGQTLEEYADSHVCTESDILDVGICLCQILQYLHGLTPPLIHRDLKPSNIVRQEDGSIYLIDFEISRYYTEGKQEDTVWCGTKEYAAPEQYGYMQTGAYSDIYSLGIVLTWMLTGETAPIRRPGTELEKVLARCTSFDPEKRIGDAGQMQRLLEALFPEARRKKRKKRKLLAALTALLAVAAAVWVVLSRWGSVRFQEPLMEEAVRTMLDRRDGVLTSQDLEQVTQIYILYNKVYTTEDAFRAGAAEWEEANCPHGELVSLEDVEEMPNLQVIMIWGEGISDLTPLTGLSRLRKVDFRENDIKDISALAGKEELWHVGFNKDPLEDISALGSCPALTVVDLREAGEGYSGEVVAGMEHLEILDIANGSDAYLYLAGKDIDDISLGSPSQRDLECIRDTRVRRLTFGWSEVRDISALTDREDITFVNLTDCDISDLSPLLTMPNLNTVLAGESQRRMFEKLTAGKEVPFVVEYY